MSNLADTNRAMSNRVDPAKYKDLDLNADVNFAPTVLQMLRQAGFDAHLDPKFEQIHDTL